MSKGGLGKDSGSCGLLSAVEPSSPPSSYFIGPYAIRKHRKAPLYKDPLEAEKYFEQIVSEVQSENFNPNREAFSLIQQTGYVSLWFFLSCICAYTGPYDRLNDSLSLDMCNTRQSDEWELEGAMAAAFIPRNMYKSTVFSHGGNTWDIIRDPNSRIVIVNAIFDKAVEFMKITEMNFLQNPLMAYLYPKFCDFSKGKGTATDKMFITPARTRNYVEPTIKPLGVAGAAEGGHYTRIDLDDLVGLDSLSSSRAGNMNMEQAKKWLGTNLDALKSDQTACVGVVATRYAVDDCYQRIYDSCKSVRGYTRGDLQPALGGEWNVYWRLVEEDGFFIRPSVMNKEKLDRLMIDDPWAAMTQWYNSPYKTGLAEFTEAEVKECKLVYQDESWFIVKLGDNTGDPFEKVVPLIDCDVVMSVDPAATEKGITAKTSRTSIGVWACDSKDNKYRIWSRVGYFNQQKTIDHIFEGHRIFKGYIPKTIVEVNAYQKVLKEYLDREQFDRGIYIGCQGVQAGGDKVARIRVALGTYLAKGKLWASADAGREFREELKIFPMSLIKIDVLDESEKGITYTRQPEDPEQRELRILKEEEELSGNGVMSAFGY